MLFWQKDHWLLFIWSVLCFLCGMLFCITAHHYYTRVVMKKAHKLLEELSAQRGDPPETPLTRKDDHERTGT